MEKTQNKTKIMFSILVLLLLVLTACLFAACGEGPVSPEIEIKAAFKTEYVIGDELDVSGGILAHTNEDGQTKDVEITEEMISGFTTETAGTRSMVLTYEGLTLTIEYEVKSPALPTVGVVYRAITTLSGEDSRFYVLFVDENTIKIVLGTDECLDPNNSAWDRVDALVSSATRTVENGKCVYSFDNGGSTEAKLTVESETSLTFVADDANYTFTISSQV